MKYKDIIGQERQYKEEFFKLMQENPDLPVVPMVHYEVVSEDSGRWLGSWGSSYIGEYLIQGERVYFREDDDPSEVERVLSERYGQDYYLNMSNEQEKKAYAEMPWIKAIIVDIDLPE